MDIQAPTTMDNQGATQTVLATAFSAFAFYVSLIVVFGIIYYIIPYIYIFTNAILYPSRLIGWLIGGADKQGGLGITPIAAMLFVSGISTWVALTLGKKAFPSADHQTMATYFSLFIIGQTGALLLINLWVDNLDIVKVLAMLAISASALFIAFIEFDSSIGKNGFKGFIDSLFTSRSAVAIIIMLVVFLLIGWMINYLYSSKQKPQYSPMPISATPLPLQLAIPIAPEVSEAPMPLTIYRPTETPTQNALPISVTPPSNYFQHDNEGGNALPSENAPMHKYQSGIRECVFKPVMTGEDFVACGLDPSTPPQSALSATPYIPDHLPSFHQMEAAPSQIATSFTERECVFKPIMTGADFVACGLNPSTSHSAQ